MSGLVCIWFWEVCLNIQQPAPVLSSLRLFQVSFKYLLLNAFWLNLKPCFCWMRMHSMHWAETTEGHTLLSMSPLSEEINHVLFGGGRYTLHSPCSWKATESTSGTIFFLPWGEYAKFGYDENTVTGFLLSLTAKISTGLVCKFS